MEYLRNIPMIKETREDNNLINSCKDGDAAFLFGYDLTWNHNFLKYPTAPYLQLGRNRDCPDNLSGHWRHRWPSASPLKTHKTHENLQRRIAGIHSKSAEVNKSTHTHSPVLVERAASVSRAHFCTLLLPITFLLTSLQAAGDEKPLQIFNKDRTAETTESGGQDRTSEGWRKNIKT